MMDDQFATNDGDHSGHCSSSCQRPCGSRPDASRFGGADCHPSRHHGIDQDFVGSDLRECAGENGGCDEGGGDYEGRENDEDDEDGEGIGTNIDSDSFEHDDDDFDGDTEDLSRDDSHWKTDSDLGHSNNEHSYQVLEYFYQLPHFEHEPLQDASNQIRLLRFVQNPDHGLLECTLETLRTDNAPQYAAISYAWGSPSRAKVISLNNHHYRVTKNCHYALKQVANHCKDHDIYIWIDSICINQIDLEEKSAQVQHMSQVYERASTVYACVGESEGRSARVISSVQQLCTYFDQVPKESDSVDVLTWTWLEEHIRSTWTDISDETTPIEEFETSLTAFCNRPYWSRVWIVQETWLAHDLQIMCGEQCIRVRGFSILWEQSPDQGIRTQHDFRLRAPGSAMNTVLSHSRHLPYKGTRDTYGVTHSIPNPWLRSPAQVESSKFKMDIISGLLHFRAQRCFDFRDRIYALQHVVAWPRNSQHDGEYGIKPVDLFCKTVRRLDPFPDHGMSLFNELTEFLPRLQLPRLCVDLEELRWKRNNKPPSAEEEDAFPDSRQKALITLEKYVEQSVLRKNKDGTLSADLGPSKAEMWRHWEYDAEKMVTLIEASKAGSHLYADGVYIGRLPLQASAGDLLLRMTDCVDEPWPFWLVLRDTGASGILEIVGAAVVKMGWAANELQASEGLANSAFDVFMDAEDLLNVCYFRSSLDYDEGWVDECVTMRVARERFSSYVSVRKRIT